MSKARTAARSRLFKTPGCAEVMEKLRAAVKVWGQAQVARNAKVTRATVCDVLAGRTAPSGKLARYLGYEVRYVRLARRRNAPATISGDDGVGPRAQPDLVSSALKQGAAASAPQGTSE